MDENVSGFKTVKIVYYSGTGGTERVARCFEAKFKAIGADVSMQRLATYSILEETKHELLLMIYAVHACNAPEPVYKWIEKAPMVMGVPAVVIAVSGGGEVIPNTACRKHCIKRLEKKGYGVISEEMIVMPSNWIVSTKEPLALMLLEILPDRVTDIVKDITAGINRKVKPAFIDNFFSYIGELEKLGAKEFGKRIKVSSDCNGCSLCSQNCNAGNITMIANKPYFGKQCQLCLKCIYDCPQKALAPGMGKFVVIKEGYNLDELEKKLPHTELVDVDKLAKGYLWSGVKKYLLDEK